jgi:hypothetical protein
MIFIQHSTPQLFISYSYLNLNFYFYDYIKLQLFILQLNSELVKIISHDNQRINKCREKNHKQLNFMAQV